MESRTEQMYSGATADHIRQVPPRYTPKSVLDTLAKSPNGYGESDADRLLIGGDLLPSTNGRSEETASKRRYLDSTTHSL